MPERKSKRLFCLAALCSLALSSLLIGCDTATTPSSGTVTSSVPTLVESPKGPGSVSATASAVPGNCSTGSITAASTADWKIYKDSRFHFQFAIPPDWRAGSFTDDSGNDYIVQIFPPGSTTPVGQAGLADQEHFEISIALAGPTGTYASDANWKAEAGSIMISGMKATIYDRASPDCGEVNRAATADLGRHHFTFFLTSVPDKAKRDITLFLGMLQSFVYTG